MSGLRNGKRNTTSYFIPSVSLIQWFNFKEEKISANPAATIKAKGEDVSGKTGSRAAVQALRTVLNW